MVYLTARERQVSAREMLKKVMSSLSLLKKLPKLNCCFLPVRVLPQLALQAFFGEECGQLRIA